ncbi:MAG TPA: Mut7-C RNAse domain-containing protein [Burkholderiales bacterium]|nr:Mut7-C RNAse domain-containing protein [Burkholderiales bacterium]
MSAGERRLLSFSWRARALSSASSSVGRVLTRDCELLKRRDVLRGCKVHDLKPEDQLREIAHRYGIAHNRSASTGEARTATACATCLLSRSVCQSRTCANIE